MTYVRFPKVGRRWTGVLWLAVALTACGDDSSRADAGPDAARDSGSGSSVQAVFDPADGRMDFGVVGFPNDLYRDEMHRVSRIGALPGEDTGTASPYHDGLRTALAELDGFSITSPVYVFFRGEIDPASLPDSPSSSVGPMASVFLIDVDLGSSEQGMRTPVRFHWTAGKMQLAARPSLGHPLVPGRQYALVVTDGLRDAAGLAVSADPDFATVRDASAAPSDPVLARVFALYDPVLRRLATAGVMRDHVVALVPFTTQTTDTDMDDARRAVWMGSAPAVADPVPTPREGYALEDLMGHPAMQRPGRDNPSSMPDVEHAGIAHDNIGYVVHASFQSPSFESDVPGGHQHFVRGADGMLRVRSMQTVPFTLVLPKADSPSDYENLRLVLFQHGIGNDRHAVLGVADALCAAGFAVLAVDAPFHGMRASGATDVTNNTTGVMAPDGFGDLQGTPIVVSFAGVVDTTGDLGAFQPVYLRDGFRQTAVDNMTAVRLVREGSWDAIRALAPELAQLSFSTERLACVGNSLGSMANVILLAHEPELSAGVLSVPGGSFIELVTDSQPFNSGYFPLLFPLLGLGSASDVDYEADNPIYSPELAIWGTVLDRGDAMAYARRLRQSDKNLLMLMGRNDETIHNSAQEGLARELDLPIASGTTPLYADLASASPPLRANYEAMPGIMATRGLWIYDPGTHGILLDQRGTSKLVPQALPPFAMRAMPLDIQNPVAQVQQQVVRFLETWTMGTAELAAPTVE